MPLSEILYTVTVTVYSASIERAAAQCTALAHLHDVSVEPEKFLRVGVLVAVAVVHLQQLQPLEGAALRGLARRVGKVRREDVGGVHAADAGRAGTLLVDERAHARHRPGPREHLRGTAALLQLWYRCATCVMLRCARGSGLTPSATFRH